MPFSAALLILWAPGGFRFTCYYYRGAYYKAFWADPPSCAVGEPRKSYRGENSFPLILQNVHRYFLYLALLFLIVLWRDVWKAMWFADPATGATTFGIGVGTLVLAANTTLLSGYTLGCHSFRHLVGGRLDRFSGASDADEAVRRGLPLQLPPQPLGVGEPVRRRARRSLRAPLLDGRPDRLEDSLTYETHEHDVLVIGAGGAGLARRDRGVGGGCARSACCASRCSARRTR